MIRLRSSGALESIELSDDDVSNATSNQRGLDALAGLDEPQKPQNRKRRQPAATAAEAPRPPRPRKPPIVSKKGDRDERECRIVSKLMHAGKALSSKETQLKQEQTHSKAKNIYLTIQSP